MQDGESRSIVLQSEKSAEIGGSSDGGGAQEIAGSVGNDSRIAEASVGRRAGERVEGGEGAPVGRELEDHALLGHGSEGIRSVEGTGLEQKGRVIGVRAVHPSGKGVEELKSRPVGLQ